MIKLAQLTKEIARRFAQIRACAQTTSSTKVSENGESLQSNAP